MVESVAPSPRFFDAGAAFATSLAVSLWGGVTELWELFWNGVSVLDSGFLTAFLGALFFGAGLVAGFFVGLAGFFFVVATGVSNSSTASSGALSMLGRILSETAVEPDSEELMGAAVVTGFDCELFAMSSPAVGLALLPIFAAEAEVRFAPSVESGGEGETVLSLLKDCQF